jgi:dipeptidyl aminopeptidase/acylaminoacyl peptidase
MHRTVITPALLALAAASLCASSAVAQQTRTNTKSNAAASTPTPLIPRDVLFGNPERAGVQISPDGKRLAYIAPWGGVLNVWVGPADRPEAAKPVTNDKSRGIRQFSWAVNGDYILFLQDKGGDENFHVYSVNLKTGAETDLTPFDGARGGIAELSREFPDEVLLSVNNRNPALFDLHRLNLVTGERSVLEQNDQGFTGYVTDDNFKARLATRMNPAGGIDVFQKGTGGEWEPLLSIPMEDTLTTSPIGFTKDGQTVYMMDSRGSNTGRFVAYDLKTGEITPIAANDKADVSNAMINPITKEVEAVAFNYTKNEWEFLDTAMGAEFETIRSKVGPGEINLTSRSLDDQEWTLAITDDNGPVRYYLYDRETDTPTFLFTNRPALEDLTLAPMHPVVIPSRDGLDLVSYLTLPTWLDTNEDMVPDAGALPMVLLVHGGPWARDNWGFNPYHQWLANRGYAVLSVNFRGSTGFGKDFLNAANLEWGTKMHDDLLDAVDWAVENGVAKKDKVAIMGGSYGGYATLAGLTFTPDVFAAGVDIVGPSNLKTLLDTIPAYWGPMRQMFYTRMGDPNTPEGLALLEERSPVNHADKIRKPLLIGQGANDPRVKQAESDQIVTAMKNHNIPVTYVLFPDEGHGFARPENSQAFNSVTENFLAMHLGGRSQPITAQDFEGSTIQVPEGATGVRGLADALVTHEKNGN